MTSRFSFPWLTTFCSLLCCWSLASCNSAFNKEWRAARSKPMAAGSIEGAWEGSWLSHHNGHNGVLRCVILPAPAGTTDKSTHEREIYYYATWAKVLSGSMKAPHRLAPLPAGKGVSFTAQHDLGSFGNFTAKGTITPSEFKATYEAAGDHGVFEMKRPQ